MKILLFGSNGQVGWEAQRSLACLGDVIALDQDQVDFHRPEKFRHIVADTKPDVIVNAAAYTAVDRAETEIQAARAINTTAPGELASLARKSNCAFIHFSTDYVYDGTKGSSYNEMDVPNPINIYGQTKLEGDLAIQQAGGAYLILRTSWVYSLRGDSFVRKVLAWARQPGPKSGCQRRHRCTS
jgi:dTDP-4-dehydrorhamnose reductase